MHPHVAGARTLEPRRDQQVDNVAVLPRDLPELVKAEGGGSRDQGMRAGLQDRRRLTLRLGERARQREVDGGEQRSPWAAIPEAVADSVPAEPGLQGLGTRND